MSYIWQGPIERRVYHLSGCERIVSYDRSEWEIVETLAGLTGKDVREVLQLAASQFENDAFERHGPDANLEIMHRILLWGDGICGAPVNAIPDPRLAPRP